MMKTLLSLRMLLVLMLASLVKTRLKLLGLPVMSPKSRRSDAWNKNHQLAGTKSYKKKAILIS